MSLLNYILEAKKLNNLYNNIALRSLNHSKTLNPIMYLSIRCFFENLSKNSVKNNFFEDYIERKLLVRKKWSTKQHKLFKEIKEDKFIYRNILSLSTFGMVSESYLMKIIAESGCFNNQEYVYSYLLPNSTNSTRNYQYYFNGYQKRNNDISKVFSENKESIALVLDLEKFYPTVNKAKVKEAFLKVIRENSDYDIIELVENITTSIMEQSIDGIPIGLNLSHLLAQVYLNDFDIDISEKYPNKYFRYVDDLVIICNADKIDEVKKHVADALPIELNINETKTDKLSFEDWSLLNKPSNKEPENFYDLLNFITAYISMHPSRIDDLEKELNTNGYNIPLSRIKKNSKSTMYMKFIISLMNTSKIFTKFEIYFSSNENIIGKLDTLKAFYLNQFKELIKLNYSNTNTAENRSNTQQLKYTLNRLLYLSSTKELTELLKDIPTTDKFADTREVIITLSSKNLHNAIQYGGKVIQTVCELWEENKFETIKLSNDDFSKIKNHNDIVDSIIILYLYKVITFDTTDILSFFNNINQQYLQVVIDETYIPKPNNDNQYIIELYGLFKDINLDEKYNLLVTRYDNNESIQLAGLDLGIGYSL